MPFADRSDAGRRLASLLGPLRGQRVVVLGIARGGVPVAFEVAQALGAPLDVVVVRKLGVPRQPELGMGAMGEEGVRVLNPDVIREVAVEDADLAAVEARERSEVDRQAVRFRGGRPPTPLQGATAVVVDDGIATGSTARAACAVARARGAGRVVVAVPVASPSALRELRSVADEVVCVDAPVRLWAVGQWYRDFAQASDELVADLLARAAVGRGVDQEPVEG